MALDDELFAVLNELRCERVREANGCFSIIESIDRGPVSAPDEKAARQPAIRSKLEKQDVLAREFVLS